MLQKLKKKLKRRSKRKKRGSQGDSPTTTPGSSTLSQTSLSTNLSAQQTLVPSNLADPISRSSSAPAPTTEYASTHQTTSIPSSPSVDLLPSLGSSSGLLSTTAAPNISSIAGLSSQSGSSTLPVNPPSEHPAAESHRSQIGSPTTSGSKGNVPSPDRPTRPSTPPSWMNNAFRVSKTILRTFAIFTGAPALDSFVESLEAKQVTEAILTKEDLEEYCRHLLKSVEEMKGSNTPPKLKGNLERFSSTLSQISKELHDGGNDATSMERICRKMTQTMHSFMLVNGISGIVKIEDTLITVEKHALRQSIQNIPHVDAAYNDYESQKKSGACFDGTREALLEDIAAWISVLETLQIYLLSGIAGTGKSTVAYTVAKRAEQFGYLGASFFFSRDEVERSNAKRFFTTIAFQLCLYNKVFAREIEKALLTEQGLAAVAKDPITQLEALILDPLRDIVKSRSDPVVTVIDALDECDDQDAPIVLAALNRLVQELPCFKVILTTRPQPHIPPLPNAHKVFHLQDIEEKIIDSDIRLYLEHHLSRENISRIFPKLRKKWGASSQDIDSLVQAAGRLFIIASTSLRFILNPRFGDPECRMEDLRYEIDSNQLSFKDLDRFYTIILHTVINEDSDKYTKRRYQHIIGTIIVIQEPLPIETLKNLTGSWSADSIETLLCDLQSVILVKDDTPRVYHKSFPDFVTNCKDNDLRIVPRDHHTRLAIRCFEIMNASLRQNILNLGTPARFMNNDAGLAEEGISAEQLTEKIPHVLHYACTYWANHVEGADSEDPDLVWQADTFIKEHLLHWLEVLSLIGRLDTATDALHIILKSISLHHDLHGMISDGLHFIPKFYNRIRQAALHTYYSGLSFTPTKCLLRSHHSKEFAHCLCQLEGVPAQWNPLIARITGGDVDPHVMFSNDGSKLSMHCRGEMRLSNSENGAIFRTFKADRMSIAYDFSAVAVSQGSAVSLWSVENNIPMATFIPSGKVVKLALSFDGSRLAAGLSNGTVGLWDAWKGESMTSIGGYEHDDGGQLEFAPCGYRLAFVSGDSTMQLWDGRDEKLVARLDYMSKKHVKFVFSHDSCRLASLVKGTLTLWGGEKGDLIGVAESIGKVLAISEDGSFIATGEEKSVHLWSGNSLSLLDTMDVDDWIWSLAISHGVLAIGCNKTLRLYDINNRAFIATLQQGYPVSLAFSPDFTRLAIGNYGGNVLLYDAPSLKAFTPASKQEQVSALAFSSDSARLAAGFADGTIQLWDTARIKQPIAAHELHSRQVGTVKFSPDGNWFASGSDDQTVRLWDGRDGAPLQLLEHSFTHSITSMAFSRSLLAASTKSNIALFDHQSLRVVDTLEKGSDSLSFSADGSCIASAYRDGPTSDVTVWNVDGWVAIAEFQVGSKIERLTFSPDGSQLAVQAGWRDGRFNFFDIVNKQAIELTEGGDLHWIPNFADGVLISAGWDRSHGTRLVGRFVGHSSWVPILWVSREFSVSRFAIVSSMGALGCADGRILFFRF